MNKKLTLQELELLNTASAYNGEQHRTICGKAALELIEYKKIEEYLGIDLITLFKALEQGIYFKNEYSKEKEIIFARPTLSIHFELYVNPLCVFQLGSYGITWALTKEELL